MSSLDLSPVPGLEELRCGFSQMNKLDIRPLHNLKLLLIDDYTRVLQRPDQEFRRSSAYAEPMDSLLWS